MILLEDLRARDVGGHEVGGELDALARQVHDLGHAGGEQRLGGARRPLDQAVAAGEHGHEHLSDGFVLAHDDLAQLCGDPVAGALDALEERLMAPVARSILRRRHAILVSTS